MRRRVVVGLAVFAGSVVAGFGLGQLHGWAWWGAMSGCWAWTVAMLTFTVLLRRRTRRLRREAELSYGGFLAAGLMTVSQAQPASGLAQFIVPTVQSMAPTEPLPVRHQDEPIRAWKRAGFVVAGGELRLLGVGRFVSYLPDDDARCPDNKAGHTPPVPDCGCGFYGARREHLDGLRSYRGVADLEVDFSGRVIACENVWKAEHQRVLGVHLDSRCHCGRPAELVCVGPTAFVHCSACSPPDERFEVVGPPGAAVSIHSHGGAFIGRATPGHPVDVAVDHGTHFTPAEIADRLGVEVRWREQPDGHAGVERAS